MKSFLAKSSTRVNSISYQPETRELFVEFKRGGTYKYLEVPEEVYIALANTESIGKTLNSSVIGKYQFIRT